MDKNNTHTGFDVAKGTGMTAAGVAMALENPVTKKTELVREINWMKGHRKLNVLGLILALAVLSIQWNTFVSSKYSWFSLLIIIPMVVIHEGLHGVFFKIWTGKVKFGYLNTSMGPSFYAASPGSSMKRNRFILLAVAPQLLTLVTFVLSFLTDIRWLSFSLLSMAAWNLCGGIMDLYVVYVLLKYPKSTHVEDAVTGMKIFKEI
jgi:hypothetical protein